MKMNSTDSKLQIENNIELEAAWILSNLKSGSAHQLPQIKVYDAVKEKAEEEKQIFKRGRKKRQAKKDVNQGVVKNVEQCKTSDFENLKKPVTSKRGRRRNKNDLDLVTEVIPQKESKSEPDSTSEKKTRKRRKNEVESKSDGPKKTRKRRGKKRGSAEETGKDYVIDSKEEKDDDIDSKAANNTVTETVCTEKPNGNMNIKGQERESIISAPSESMKLPHVPSIPVPNSSSPYLGTPLQIAPLWSLPSFPGQYIPRNIFDPRPIYPVPFSLFPIPGARPTANVPLPKVESQQIKKQTYNLHVPMAENESKKLNKQQNRENRQNSALDLTQTSDFRIAQRNMLVLSGGSVLQRTQSTESDTEGKIGQPSCKRDAQTPDSPHLMSQLPFKKRRTEGSLLGSSNSTPCASPQPQLTTTARNGPVRENDTSNATSPSSVSGIEDRKQMQAFGHNSTEVPSEKKSHQLEEVLEGTNISPKGHHGVDHATTNIERRCSTEHRGKDSNSKTSSPVLPPQNKTSLNENLDTQKDKTSDVGGGSDSDSTVDFEKDLTWKGHLISVTARKNSIYVTQAKNGLKQNITHEKDLTKKSATVDKDKINSGIEKSEENKCDERTENETKNSDMQNLENNNNNADKLEMAATDGSGDKTVRNGMDEDSRSSQVSPSSTTHSPMRIDPTSSLRLLYECKQAVTPDEDGDLPLHIAVAQENETAVKQLLRLMHELGVSVNIYNKMRQTSLHLAVITEQPSIAKLLLEAGADPNQPDRHGNSSLHLSVIHASNECLGLLLSLREPPVNLAFKNYDGLTSLHIAVEKGNRYAVETLLTTEIDTNIQDGKSGRSALFFAAEKNQLEIVTLLIKNGASVNLPNYSGASPIQVANSRGYSDISKALLQGGASPLSRKDENFSLYSKMSKSKPE